MPTAERPGLRPACVKAALALIIHTRRWLPWSVPRIAATSEI